MDRAHIQPRPRRRVEPSACDAHDSTRWGVIRRYAGFAFSVTTILRSLLLGTAISDSTAVSLRPSPRRRRKSNAKKMHISALYIHPIKSLLPIALQSSTVTALGLPHDRTFVLVRAPQNTPLHIGHLSQLCLFSVAITDGDDDSASLEVTHTLAGDTLRIPLVPPVLGEAVEVTMHLSACTGFAVGADADVFFSRHLGFAARLLFIGPSTRKVLGNIAPAQQQPGFLASWFAAAAGKQQQQEEDAAITFADCAPLLVTTAASLAAVSARTGDDVDVRKFRPNIVLAADDEDGREPLQPWEEDYWAELEIGEDAPATLLCTANCGRCLSLNVDFATGGFVENHRQPLKLLMKDRRVDSGVKFSPVFGRYAFLRRREDGGGVVLRVGDRVRVSKRNEERTVFGWSPPPPKKKKKERKKDEEC